MARDVNGGARASATLAFFTPAPFHERGSRRAAAIGRVRKPKAGCIGLYAEITGDMGRRTPARLTVNEDTTRDPRP